MYQHIMYETNNHVATITLNSPATANGFSVALCKDMLHALQDVETNPDIYALVLAGNGPIFSAGGDLTDMKRMFESQDIQEFSTLIEYVGRISMTLKRMPKPVVLLAYRAVAGAAFNLALASDFVLAAEDTKFIQAFVNVGLAPDAGGMFLLSRAVGLNRALHLAMTGAPVTTQQGKDWGFVYDTYSNDAELTEKKEKLLQQLCSGPRLAFGTMKQMLWKAFLKDWEDYASEEKEMQTVLGASADSTEGVLAFLEKRSPCFQGK